MSRFKALSNASLIATLDICAICSGNPPFLPSIAHPPTAFLVEHATLLEAVRDLKGLIELYVKVPRVDNF